MYYKQIPTGVKQVYYFKQPRASQKHLWKVVIQRIARPETVTAELSVRRADYLGTLLPMNDIPRS